MKSSTLEPASVSLLASANMSEMVFRARVSMKRPCLASSAASSNWAAIRRAWRLSVVPVLRFVRRPSGSVKHAIQNGELDKRRNEAISSYNTSYRDVRELGDTLALTPALSHPMGEGARRAGEGWLSGISRTAQ